MPTGWISATLTFANRTCAASIFAMRGLKAPASMVQKFPAPISPLNCPPVRSNCLCSTAAACGTDVREKRDRRERRDLYGIAEVLSRQMRNVELEMKIGGSSEFRSSCVSRLSRARDSYSAFFRRRGRVFGLPARDVFLTEEFCEVGSLKAKLFSRSCLIPVISSQRLFEDLPTVGFHAFMVMSRH